MDKLNVGKIVNTFGIKGELKVQIITDFASERFRPGKRFFIENDEVILKSCRYHKGFALLLFENLEDINLVECYKDKNLTVSKDDIEPLKDGYYFYQLADLSVINNATGDLVGTVSDIESYPANNVLRVATPKGDVLVPYVKSFVEKVDLDEKKIYINVIEGLL